jgi:hypothetical protein
VTENSFGDPMVMKRSDERCFATPCPGQKMGEAFLEQNRIHLHPIDPS